MLASMRLVKKPSATGRIGHTICASLALHVPPRSSLHFLKFVPAPGYHHTNFVPVPMYRPARRAAAAEREREREREMMMSEREDTRSANNSRQSAGTSPAQTTVSVERACIPTSRVYGCTCSCRTSPRSLDLHYNIHVLHNVHVDL